jgi:DNA-binding transcriptional MerR regulator
MNLPATMRVGAVAQQTGVTVRTLHHYEELGLLVPSHRSEANHRLYCETDLLRLQQILSLRQIGLPLTQIAVLLDDPDSSIEKVLEKHLLWLQGEGERLDRLCGLLQQLQKDLASGQGCSVEQITETIQWTEKMNQYFTEQQQQDLKQRHDAFDPEAMQKAQEAWATLGVDLSAAVAEGMAPDSSEGMDIGRRFRSLIDAFTGGDAQMEQSLGEMNRNEPQVLEGHGWPSTPETQEFLRRAVEAATT